MEITAAATARQTVDTCEADIVPASSRMILCSSPSSSDRVVRRACSAGERSDWNGLCLSLAALELVENSGDGWPESDSSSSWIIAHGHAVFGL